MVLSKRPRVNNSVVHYRSIEQLFEIYQKAIPDLMIDDKYRLQEQLREKYEKINELSQKDNKIDMLKNTILEIKNNMLEIQNKFKMQFYML